MEPRPGRIKRILPVDLPRARNRLDLEFVRLKEEILGEFGIDHQAEAEAMTA
jgi:ABC-type nitrate/sulfonate/bicarbonate transport system ATPase subunit